jgi:hypothetical protein
MHNDRLVNELEKRSIQPSSCNTNNRLLELAIKDHGSKFSFSRAIRGSFGCVNAISLSKGAGTFLAFGGDDCRVLVFF